MPSGNPKYTEELATEICQRISTGESLRKICEDNHINVDESTVRLWNTEDYEGFATHYARAREDQGTFYANKVNEVAEDVLTEKYRPDQGRVAIDAFKWTAGKLNGKYSDKTININRNTNVTVDLDELTDADLITKIKEDGKK